MEAGNLTATMPPQPDTLERQTVYSLLADRTREYLLWHLSVVDRTTTREAAAGIRELRRETVADASRVPDRQSIVIELTHDHLPRFDEHGVVDYERSSGEIAPGRNFSDLEPYVADLELPVNPRSISY